MTSIPRVFVPTVIRIQFDLAQRDDSDNWVIQWSIGTTIVDAEECRKNALTCFRLAQNIANTEGRRGLFKLMVQWRRLADKFRELEQFVPIFDAIANWVKKYRYAVGLRDDLANCGADEVARMARDLGVDAQELISLATKGPQAADQLSKLLRALGVDPEKLTSGEIAMMRDLQRICISCGHKNQCERDLATGTASQHFRDYCPNALSIDALLYSNEER